MSTVSTTATAPPSLPRPEPVNLEPTQAELEEIFRMRHGALETTGWNPKQRRRFGYFTPDEYYEAVVEKLVTNTVDLRYFDTLAEEMTAIEMAALRR